MADLHLKAKFKNDRGYVRVNDFKLTRKNGYFQLYIENGQARDSESRKYAQFRLNAIDALAVIEFLQGQDL